VNIEDEKSLLTWFNEATTDLVKDAEERTTRQMTNLAAYRNITVRGNQRRNENSDSSANISPSGFRSRVNVNYIFDMVKQHVAKLTKFRPAVSVQPYNDDDYNDIITTKIAEDILDSIWYRQNIDSQIRHIHRIKKIFGECHIFPIFNPLLGEPHPDYVNVCRQNSRVPLLDESNNQILGADNKPLYIDIQVKVGEIEHIITLPWNVFYEKVETYEDKNYILYREVFNVDTLKARYPAKASKIKAGGTDSVYPMSSVCDMVEFGNNDTEMWTFFHRGTNELSKGFYAKFTKDVVLECSRNKYTLFGQPDIPNIRICDEKIPGLLTGATSLDNARNVSDSVNKLNNMILRNQFLAAHPKWMVQRGSVKIESLGNDISIVQYTGANQPILAQANPTPREIFEFRNLLKEEMFQFEGLYPVSRGEPPAGIKAFVALQFLDEQESERANESVADHNAMIRDIAIWDLALAGSFYDDSDGRLVKLLGSTKAKQVPKNWSFKNLTRQYDVKVQNSSALPQQRAARTQFIFDMAERFPNMISNEQIIDMLDLGQSKKFSSTITTAVRSAEQENEELCRTSASTPPEVFEDHIIHYGIHYRLLNEHSTKAETPIKVLEGIKDHVRAHEMFMLDIAQKTPQYLEQILIKFPAFPLFFVMEQPPMMPTQPPMMPTQPPIPPMPAESQQIAMQAEAQGLPPSDGISMPAGVENIEQPIEPEALQGQML
jgi:hypothetical protein